IRKVVAQRAENNQKIYKKDNFYIISIEIVFFSLIQELYVPDSFRDLCPRLIKRCNFFINGIILFKTVHLFYQRYNFISNLQHALIKK
ncbi:hypothetical protein ABC932_13230, partial [Staphylococcus aureus]